MVTAGALRLASLSTQPGGLYPDEAAEGFDALRLLHQPGFHPVFFLDDAGREGLYAYLVAAAFRLAGESAVTLRATSAVIGTVAVLAAYGWLRRWGTATALTGAAWMGGSLWLICISRDGMRNVLVPLVGALAVWAMAAWADRPSRKRALIAGAAMALGLWTYQPLKLLPVLLALWLWWLNRQYPVLWQRLRGGLAALAIAYVIVGAPMLVTAILEPGPYFGRAVGVSIAGHDGGAASLGIHTLRTLGMFAFTGDPNQRHDVDGLPLLGLPLTLLMLLGAWRAWRARRQDPAAALVLIAVPVFLLPPLIGTADAAPHFLRSIGLAAPLAALIGLGAAEVVAVRREVLRPPWPAVLVALLIGATTTLGAVAYFTRPASHRYADYSFNLVQLSGAIRPDQASIVLLDYYQGTDVRFLNYSAVVSQRVSVVDPAAGRRPVEPARSGGCAVLALSSKDISSVYGPTVAGTSAAVAWDPQGRPTVWRGDC
ncbi:MAG: ArnT family glycosyltransferase [Candidatus Dormibacteria bacterium]